MTFSKKAINTMEKKFNITVTEKYFVCNTNDTMTITVIYFHGQPEKYPSITSHTFTIDIKTNLANKHYNLEEKEKALAGYMQIGLNVFKQCFTTGDLIIHDL